MNHRGFCVRCGDKFEHAVHFGRHLKECSHPLDVDLVLRATGCEEGDPENCWEMSDARVTTSMPKLGIAYKTVVRAHVVMAIAAHGDERSTKIVCHRCDNRKCLNPSHLYWGTANTNAEDAWRNGRRTMSAEQKEAMVEGLRSSQKHKERMAEHNRALAQKNSGDNHWTRKDPAKRAAWLKAMREGRLRAEGGDAR